MLIRLLKYNTAAGYLLIPLFLVIAWLPALLSGTYHKLVFDEIPMPLYELLTGYLPHHSLLSRIVAMLLLLLTGFYLVRLNNKYLLLPERTLLPAFLFIVITSSVTPLHRLHPVLAGMVFFLPAIDKLLDSYKTERLSYNYFEAPFLIGLGSLFYFNLIWFAILVWVAILILRPVIWREWIFGFLGIAMPWLFFMATDYFLHDSLEWSSGIVTRNFTTRDLFNLMHLPEKIYFSVMFLLLLIASRHIYRSMPKMKVLSRKIFILFFWVYFVSTAAYFFVETANVELTIPGTIPVAFLLSHYILSLRKGLWRNLILWFIVAGVQILAWLP